MKRISITIMLLSTTLIIGCSQEKNQPAEAQPQSQQQQTTSAPPTSQEFMFRGIKMGVPISNQFKECIEGSKEPCWRKSSSSTSYIHNLPTLGFETDESVSEENGKVTEISLKSSASNALQLVELMKQKYGSAVGQSMNQVCGPEPVTTYGPRGEPYYSVQNVCHDYVTVKWTVGDYELTLTAPDDGVAPISPDTVLTYFDVSYTPWATSFSIPCADGFHCSLRTIRAVAS